MKVIEGKKTCGVCDQDREKGFYLYNLFICSECEQKIIHTEPNQAQYQYYLKKLRGINKSKLYS